MKKEQNSIYAGFWVRLGASLVDAVLLQLIIWTFIMYEGSPHYDPVTREISEGAQSFILLVFLVYATVFWRMRGATLGKMAFGIRIVNKKTGEIPSLGKCILRYLGYIVSSILGLGFLYIAVDKKKQGFHDKIAGTVVIRKESLDEYKRMIQQQSEGKGI